MKVLMVVADTGVTSGISSFVMNYFRNINPEDVQFDYISLFKLTPSHDKEIIEKGGNVYYLPSLSNFFSFVGKVNKVMREGKYDVIHCNLVNIAPLFFACAIKNSIQHRILHCHFTKSGETKFKELRNDLFTPIARLLATDFVACTYDAGTYLFGKQAFTTVKNAIETKKFLFNKITREKIRERYLVRDKIVIGSVGRIVHQKNPFFALDVIEELNKVVPDIEYWWIGDGVLGTELQARAQEKGIAEKVKILGNKKNVQDYYQAMDVLLFPSVYEGLGMVAIEAQAASLPVVCSTEVPREAKVTEDCYFVSLDSPKKKWVSTILNAKRTTRKSNTKAIIESGYDISHEADKLVNIYKKITN